MVDELHAIGVELMVSPYSHSVSKTSVNWEAAHSGGLLAIDGDGAANLSTPAKSYAGGYAYDLFNPAARDFAWAKMNEGYVRQYGLHHWWLDCDEPCGGTNNGSYGQNFIYNNGTWPSAFVGAAYPQMLDRMIYDGMGAPGKEYVGGQSAVRESFFLELICIPSFHRYPLTYCHLNNLSV
jgi:alpha-glucosidase (family GH31 glycosyl hydrolase)